MDIRFCTICNESVPDSDFEASRAFLANGKAQHVACALSHQGERKSATSWLPLLLALYAAGVATYLLVDHFGAKAKNKKQPAVSEAVETRIQEVADRYVKASELRQVELGNKGLGALETSLTKSFQDRLTTEWNDRIGKEFQAGEIRLKELKTSLDKRSGLVEGRASSLETEVARLDGWIRQLQEQAKQLANDALSRKNPEGGPNSNDPGSGNNGNPTPNEGTPKSANEGGSTLTPAEAAAESNALRKAVARYIDLIGDKDGNIAYPATTELARLPDLRMEGQPYFDLLKDWGLKLSAKPDDALLGELQRKAGIALLGVLDGGAKKEFWSRLGAVAALGDLRTVDSVPKLIDALQDKQEPMRAAAGEALRKITGQDFSFKSAMQKQERRAVQREYQKWWKANEGTLRTTLGQPK